MQHSLMVIIMIIITPLCAHHTQGGNRFLLHYSGDANKVISCAL